MVMRTPIRVLATPNPGRAAAALADGDLGVVLYGNGRPELPGLGAGLPQAASKLPCPVPVRAWDFLSIALAIHAADRFVVRRESPDSWTRMISLEIELVEPEPWAAQADTIAEMLRFLSGDIWYLRFRADGERPPEFQGRLSDRESVCLFSGGLDSLIGAIELKQKGERLLLVSQASPKERQFQVYLADQIGFEEHRFEGRASERWRQPYEPSSRTRSMLFIGYGAIAAAGLTQRNRSVDLIVPENGLISINAPLTRRHIGSLSTRTTHPHFVASLQGALRAADLQINLLNPYSFKTKGEMLAECRDRIIEKLAPLSYSCGKGKRLNQHCGRCIPCLIRRASFHAAGLADHTGYWADDLSQHASNEDVAAARIATADLSRHDFVRWAAETGPLPQDLNLRSAYADVLRRGMHELHAFLKTFRWS